MLENYTTPSQRPAQAGSSWPGERNPSHRDVELANESLDSSFLSTFKNSLLASSAARDNEHLMHIEMQNMHPTDSFTYPMSVLYNFPELPPEYEIDALLQSFSVRFADEVFFNTLPIPQSSDQAVVPFFKLSVACLACAATPYDATSPARRDLAKKLFFAGNKLWNVMLEVDNTEARTIEGVLAPMLLSTYGALSTDVDVWTLVAYQMLPSLFTIARRLRLHETRHTNETTTVQSRKASARSSIMSLLLLVNVLTALHMDIPIYLTSNELDIRLGPSAVHFQQAYTNLLNGDSLLDHTWTSYTNPSTLLIVILSDSISTCRSLGKLSNNSCSGLQSMDLSSFGAKSTLTPYVPLSAPSEYERILDQLVCALDKWIEHFGPGEGIKDLALYYFCRLYLSYPQLSSIPRVVGYLPAVQTLPAIEAAMSVNNSLVSDESIRYAWAILDNIDLDSGSGETTCPTWYPVVVFFAGLVVWARTQQHGSSLDGASSLMQLIAFKTQLDRMSWPCCPEMASTLHRLTRNR